MRGSRNVLGGVEGVGYPSDNGVCRGRGCPIKANIRLLSYMNLKGFN